MSKKISQRTPVVRASIILATVLILSGCTPEEVMLAVRARCPELMAYTPAQQKKAAAELRALPKGSQIADMIGDYGTLRMQCRAYMEGVR